MRANHCLMIIVDFLENFPLHLGSSELVFFNIDKADALIRGAFNANA